MFGSTMTLHTIRGQIEDCLADFLSPGDNDERWLLQIDNENTKVWTRYRGYNIIPEIPIV